MKLGLRIVLIVVIVLIVLTGVAGVKVLGSRAFLGPRSRPLASRTFDVTPARLQRGQYLANSIGCLYCHSPHDWSKRDDPILQGMTGAGQSHTGIGSLNRTRIALNAVGYCGVSVH